mmetsp:Transcript_883/g.2207  ORF Transcript_883/g.2207 Transcript_883/m.2207 type:complete len:235 (-) Transcript_883:15-719(-)
MAAQQQQRVVVKIPVLGCSNVGKTSLMKRYCNNSYTDERRATTGADFATKKIVLQDTQMVLQIWDTAGQERFHHGTLGSAFYRGADGAVLVYDVTNAKSFEQVEQWREELMQRIDSDPDQFPVVVVGNKVDLESGVAMDGTEGVNKEDVLRWCSDRGIGHIETSAKENTGVQAAMEAIAMLAHDQQRAIAANPELAYNRRARAASKVDLAKTYSKPKKKSCSGCSSALPDSFNG